MSQPSTIPKSLSSYNAFLENLIQIALHNPIFTFNKPFERPLMSYLSSSNTLQTQFYQLQQERQELANSTEDSQLAKLDAVVQKQYIVGYRFLHLFANIIKKHPKWKTIASQMRLLPQEAEDMYAALEKMKLQQLKEMYERKRARLVKQREESARQEAEKKRLQEQRKRDEERKQHEQQVESLRQRLSSLMKPRTSSSDDTPPSKDTHHEPHVQYEAPIERRLHTMSDSVAHSKGHGQGHNNLADTNSQLNHAQATEYNATGHWSVEANSPFKAKEDSSLALLADESHYNQYSSIRDNSVSAPSLGEVFHSGMRSLQNSQAEFSPIAPPLDDTDTFHHIHEQAVYQDFDVEDVAPRKTVLINQRLIDEFLNYAYQNLGRNLEFCGVLVGKIEGDQYFITHCLIPDQEGTPDACHCLNEMQLFEYQSENDLLSLGWVHTHPSQSAFLSTVDLVTQYGYQCMIEESVAVVCAPSANPNQGIFRIKDDAFEVVRRAIDADSEIAKGRKHARLSDSPLFETCSHVVCSYDVSAPAVIVDLRKHKDVVGALQPKRAEPLQRMGLYDHLAPQHTHGSHHYSSGYQQQSETHSYAPPRQPPPQFIRSHLPTSYPVPSHILPARPPMQPYPAQNQVAFLPMGRHQTTSSAYGSHVSMGSPQTHRSPHVSQYPQQQGYPHPPNTRSSGYTRNGYR